MCRLRDETSVCPTDGVIMIDPQQLNGRKGWYLEADFGSVEHTKDTKNHAGITEPLKFELLVTC